MLLKYCLLNTNMIVLRHAMFCIFMCRSMSRSINYLICFFINIFIAINHKIFLKQAHLFIWRFLSKVQSQTVAFFAIFSLVLVISVAYNKKPCTTVVILFILGILFISGSTGSEQTNEGTKVGDIANSIVNFN